MNITNITDKKYLIPIMCGVMILMLYLMMRIPVNQDIKEKIAVTETKVKEVKEVEKDYKVLKATNDTSISKKIMEARESVPDDFNALIDLANDLIRTGQSNRLSDSIADTEGSSRTGNTNSGEQSGSSSD